MAIFLLTCMPLFAVLIGSLAVAGRLHFDEPVDAADLAGQFLLGILCSVPSQIVLLFLRPSFGGSYRPWPLYLSVLLEEHVLPVGLALAFYALLRLIPALSRRTAGFASFAEGAVFVAGYFAIVSVADCIGQRGELGEHALFLLPLARMVTVVLYGRAIPQMVAAREPRERLRPLVAMVVLPMVAAFEGLWSRQSRTLPAAMVVAALVLLVAGATVGRWGAQARRGPPGPRIERPGG